MPTQVGCDQRAKFVHPTAHGFRADLDPALGHQFFDVADAQREAKIQSDRMTDHLRRKSMTLE
jgi:hypothetical protein